MDADYAAQSRLVKSEITHGHVSRRNLANMREVDLSWTQAKEPWERLRWARIAAGFSTAKAFAEAIGMRNNTYDAHERRPGSSRNTGLTAEKAMAWGKRLKVRWEWLYHGTGQPWPSEPESDPQFAELQSIYHEAAPEDREWLLSTARRVKRAGTGG